MDHIQSAPEPLTIAPVEMMAAAIAEKVRGRSENAGKLTHVEDLGPLFPEMTPEQIVSCLAQVVQMEAYQDLHVITTTGGASYLYSDKFIPGAEAGERARSGEACEKIADKVRTDSRDSLQLTAVTTLPELFPELPPEVVEEYAAKVAADDEFKDIQPVMGPTGIDYLYCETHMTGNYAALLARVEAKNPFATIAETVREESRTYPRPTRVALFYEPLFQMEPDMLESAVGSILQREEYRDIKRIVAATGAVYLYSDKYLTGARAEAWVQWHEVDQWDNP